MIITIDKQFFCGENAITCLKLATAGKPFTFKDNEKYEKLPIFVQFPNGRLEQLTKWKAWIYLYGDSELDLWENRTNTGIHYSITHRKERGNRKQVADDEQFDGIGLA